MHLYIKQGPIYYLWVYLSYLFITPYYNKVLLIFIDNYTIKESD